MVIIDIDLERKKFYLGDKKINLDFLNYAIKKRGKARIKPDLTPFFRMIF